MLLPLGVQLSSEASYYLGKRMLVSEKLMTWLSALQQGFQTPLAP